ncbi:hypothetical protein [Mycobacterium sp.]|uniref:hypothetical protein n=1 Tax=Mycobacterium sp. TaxID=1785 RepID=UPI0025FE090B|nr:hypothetical protein [Mycobacterium sp.]
MATPAQYEARAVDRIREILAVEHAVVRREVESRITEGFWQGSGDNIDAHHVTNAIRFLVDERGELEWVYRTTRGKHTVATLEPVDRTGRSDRIDRAAGRKRLLWGRYLGWATGTERYPHGLIGPAGEAATRGGILASGALIPAAQGAAGVASVLGVDLPGPLDSAGYLVPLNARGIPGPAVTLLFEVKNVRQWLYPTAHEPFQLLGKGVMVQQANPDVPVLPVLVCRRAHPSLFWMAKQLGFVIINMDVQFIGSRIDEAAYLEVRNELHFHDLKLGDGPSLRVRDRLAGTIRTHCTEFATRWQATAHDPQISAALTALAKTKSSDQTTRKRLVDSIERIVVANGWGDGW